MRDRLSGRPCLHSLSDWTRDPEPTLTERHSLRAAPTSEMLERKYQRQTAAGEGSPSCQPIAISKRGQSGGQKAASPIQTACGVARLQGMIGGPSARVNGGYAHNWSFVVYNRYTSVIERVAGSVTRKREAFIADEA